jgi:dihydroflavonol-4-reductase
MRRWYAAQPIGAIVQPGVRGRYLVIEPEAAPRGALFPCILSPGTVVSGHTGMNLADERILITGGTGFLGANLACHLVREEKVPEASLRVLYLEGGPTWSLRDLPGIELVSGDIRNPASVAAACRDRTLVFHTAGITSFDPRLKRIQWFINVEGTRNVLRAAARSGTVKKICHTSTVNILGCPNPPGSLGTITGCNPYTSRPRLHSFASSGDALAFADAVGDGRGPRDWERRIGIGYFDSKLAAQEIVDRAVREEGIDVVSVLPGTFFGPRDTLMGPSLYIVQVRRSAVPAVSRAGLPLAHVEDVARGHVLAMMNGRPGGRYIVSGRSEDNRYLADMLRIIAGVLKEKEPLRTVRSRFSVVPGPAARAAAIFAEASAILRGTPCLLSRAAVRAGSFPSFYSNEETERDIGYSPRRSFREAVEDAYEFMSQNGLLDRTEREVEALLAR